MRQIKLTNGETIDVYSVYTYNDNTNLNIDLLNTTLVKIEQLFTEDNLISISVLDAEGEVENLYNGYTLVSRMSKDTREVSKYYLGTGSMEDGSEDVSVCTVVLKLSDDLKKQLDLAATQITNLSKTQKDLTKTVEDLTVKNNELDELVALLLMDSLATDEEDEEVE